jgi:hypothetical protein
MHPYLYFWITFIVLVLAIVFLSRKYQMLRDVSTGTPKPYSYARVQLAWWTVVVLSSLVAIIFVKGALPTLDSSTLILLGISASTTVVARVTDISDRANADPSTLLSQDFNGENFLLDILSDKNGVSIHRFQAVVINLVFGIWFISQVLGHLGGLPPCTTDTMTDSVMKDCAVHPLNYMMPVIGMNNLILLGISAGTYAAVKTTENKAIV